MWEHGSGFTEQPNFWEEMNASPLCSQAGLGSSLGGDERPDCSSQESLEPSHCLGSLFSTEGMRSLLFVLFLCLRLSSWWGSHSPHMLLGTPGRGAGWSPQAARQRPEWETLTMSPPPVPRVELFCLPSSLISLSSS